MASRALAEDLLVCTRYYPKNTWMKKHEGQDAKMDNMGK